MENERGITAGEIARLLRRRIVWILAVAAFAAVAAALFTSLVYNRARREYFLTFIVEFPQEDTPFRYETLVYADNLEGAKASDEAFAAIDTERMAADEDIRIARAGEEDALPSYTVTVSGKYFADRAQATAFLRAVVERAVSLAGQRARGDGLFAIFRLPGMVRICGAETYVSGARVLYRQNTVSETENGRSPFAAAVAGFVLTFLLAGALFCAADYSAERKKQRDGTSEP